MSKLTRKMEIEARKAEEKSHRLGVDMYAAFVVAQAKLPIRKRCPMAVRMFFGVGPKKAKLPKNRVIKKRSVRRGVKACPTIRVAK